MLRDENDILADTLASNAQFVDCFYVLDGSINYERAKRICYATGKCAGYTLDAELRGRGRITDGSREYLYAQAVEQHGHDHWFLLLHGDELWLKTPEEAILAVPDADGFEFRLPFAITRAWDYNRPALQQLHEFLWPGWPEFRMFKGAEHVHFNPDQHFLARPHGLERVVRLEWPILHFPYRSPESQRLRGGRSLDWSPENYAGDVFWDDDRVTDFIASTEHYDYVRSIRGL